MDPFKGTLTPVDPLHYEPLGWQQGGEFHRQATHWIRRAPPFGSRRLKLFRVSKENHKGSVKGSQKGAIKEKV